MPCLVRRAALYAANVDDLAHYRWDELDRVMAEENRRDDVMAVARAVRRLETEDAERWVAQSRPPPGRQGRAEGRREVFARGLREIGNYLRDCGVIV